MANPATMMIKKDFCFYIGPLVIIQVEDTLFRVPRKELEEQSEVFRTMFTLPLAEHSHPDGHTDEQPLRLEGISLMGFRALLKILYPRLAPVPPLPLNEEESEAVLVLSKRWCFDRIHESMIERLDSLKLSDTRKLELARTHDIRRWYKPALIRLSRRNAALTTAEIGQIGADLYLIVLRLKEKRMEEIMKCSRHSTIPGMYGRITSTAEDLVEYNKGTIDKATDSLLQEYVQSCGWDV